MAPDARGARRRHGPPFELSPEPEALHARPRPRHRRPRRRRCARLEERDPRVAVLVEPMLGVTLTPTMCRASEKINVIPARAELQVDCRVPPELGEEHARERIREVLGEDGYEIEFDETVVGNRSPVDTPLMDHIRRFVEREDPGAPRCRVVLPGFRDSRWFREAFPDCVAYGFFPQRKMDLFEAAPLDPRRRRARPRRGPGPGRPLLRRAGRGGAQVSQAGARRTSCASAAWRCATACWCTGPRTGPPPCAPTGRDQGRLGPQAAPGRPRGRAHPGRARRGQAGRGDGGDPAGQARAARPRGCRCRTCARSARWARAALGGQAIRSAGRAHRRAARPRWRW